MVRLKKKMKNSIDNICEACGKEIKEEDTFKCLDCEILICYDCIGLDDVCPECKSQNRIMRV